jgi:hypothetical protein
MIYGNSLESIGDTRNVRIVGAGVLVYNRVEPWQCVGFKP